MKLATRPQVRLDLLFTLCRLHREGIAARMTRDLVPTRPELLEIVRWEQRATREMAPILDAHGWPGPDLVGEVGAEAAWWVTLLCDRQTLFQRDAHRLLQEAADRGAAPARHLAYLTDRLLMHDGEPKLYGTQYVLGADGTVSRYPVGAPGLLGMRRHRVGLPKADAGAAGGPAPDGPDARPGAGRVRERHPLTRRGRLTTGSPGLRIPRLADLGCWAGPRLTIPWKWCFLMSRKTVLPDVREVAEGAQQVLKGIEADGEYERLRGAALASTEVSFAGFPLISRWDAARDCGPLFTEALRAVALRASVLVLTVDDEASHLAVPAPVDAMVHVVFAQGVLVWQVAESSLLSLVHQSDRENHAYRKGCYTHACYREAWGEPPARYWLDQQEADRRLAALNERYESIGLRLGGRGHRFDFPVTVGGTR